MQTQNEGNGTVQFLMKIYWAGIWTKSRMIPSSIPSKQMKFSYWNKRKLKLGMTMNEMNDIRDMSHSKSERKQKRPILKLFINKFSPISPKWINPPPPPGPQMLNLLHPWAIPIELSVSAGISLDFKVFILNDLANIAWFTSARDHKWNPRDIKSKTF